jgi:hypothetical protein
MARILPIVLFLLWAALALYGVYVYQTTAPTDSGFTRGLNRAGEFFKWEGAALAVAIVAWFAGRGATGVAGWARRLPLLLSGGFFALVALLFLGAVVVPQ